MPISLRLGVATPAMTVADAAFDTVVKFRTLPSDVLTKY